MYTMHVIYSTRSIGTHDHDDNQKPVFARLDIQV